MVMFRFIVLLTAFIIATTQCCQPIPPSAEIMEQIRLRLKQAIEAPSDPELQNLTNAQIAALEETIDRYARLPTRYVNSHEMFDEKWLSMFSKDQIRLFKDFVEKHKKKQSLVDDIKTLDDMH